MEPGACPVGAPVVGYFDHNSREYADHRYDWYETIRESVGPVFWSPHHGGFWVVIGYDEVQQALRDWETYSSRHLIDDQGQSLTLDGVRYDGLFVPPRPYANKMLEEDPPECRVSRNILIRSFAPAAVEKWRTRVQDLVDACIDRRIGAGRIDFAADLSNIVPAIFSLEFVGVPTDHFEFVAFSSHKMTHTAATDPEWQEVAKAREVEAVRIREAIEHKRLGARGSDIISVLLDAMDGGAPISEEDVFKLARLVITAGIDTTSATLASAFITLTKMPDLKRRLAEDPSLLAKSFQEFVRMSAPTQGLCRTVTRDVELGGQSLRRGDRVMLCYAAACRDPQRFDAPDTVILDRNPNAHLGFGNGQHRCLGSGFAQLEFEVILSTVLRRMPDFRVDLDAVESFANVGVVAGYVKVPATFTPGTRVGVDPRVPGWDSDG